MSETENAISNHPRSVKGSFPTIPLFRRILAISFPFILSLPVCGAGGGAAAYSKKPDAWYSSPEAARITANILSYQSDLGGWPKNTKTVDVRYAGDPKQLHPTFDNSATIDELRFLAR